VSARTPRILATVALATTACSPYAVHRLERPPVPVPARFSAAEPEASHAVERWWREFDDPGLDRAVEEALASNLDLRQAWRRLDQALAVARISAAERFPAVDVDAGYRGTRTVDRDATDASTGRTTRLERTTRDLFVSAGLSWELDAWRRIRNSLRADRLRAEATREDVEAAALLVAGSITETWFTILEQQALLDLLDEQIETSRTLVDLTELRFSLGEGTALDVLQQRQQLASTEAEVPVVRSLRDTARHQLAVLLGRPPGSARELEPDGDLPGLPALPPLPAPVDLLATRPDLRAAARRLQASDHDVAVAVAERLPRFSIALDYELGADRLADVFERELGSLFAGLFAPVFDGGRRRAEVDRRKAVVQELLEGFARQFLAALREVEDALVREREQAELLERLERQLGLSRSNLSESRSRYSNGLVNYVTVLVAVQELQALERRLISERRRLVSFRAELYRSLGGSWMAELSPPPARRLASLTTEESQR